MIRPDRSIVQIAIWRLPLATPERPHGLKCSLIADFLADVAFSDEKGRTDSKVHVHVDRIEAMGNRFIAAWRRPELREEVDEQHVTFMNLESMTELLSPKRCAVAHVRWHGVESIRQLATALHRDYENVHQDVSALESGRISVRTGNRLSTP